MGNLEKLAIISIIGEAKEGGRQMKPRFKIGDVVAVESYGIYSRRGIETMPGMTGEIVGCLEFIDGILYKVMTKSGLRGAPESFTKLIEEI